MAEGGSAPASEANPVLREARILTSRPVLADAIQRLGRAGAMPDFGHDPVAAAQGLLHARVSGQPNVVELSAEGQGRLFLERLLNMTAESYREGTVRRYQQQMAQEDRDLRIEVRNLQDSSAGARARLEEFRNTNPAIPARADKPATADLQNLKRVYGASTTDFAKSRAWLESLSQKIDAARAAGRDKPDTVSQAAAIVAAVQQLQTNQSRLNRLRGALAEKQKEAGEIAALIAEYNLLQDDVAQAGQREQRAVALLANLPASQRERAPDVQILQPALSGASPVRPDYARNAWIAVAVSILFGFAAVRCAGLFIGTPAVAFADAPVHMPCWDGTPALTYRPQMAQPFSGGPAPVRLLPPPSPSLAT